MAQTRFSKVLTIDECSDAPNWSRMGIFSCHACDLWREKMQHCPLASSTNHSRRPLRPLSNRYKCTRKASGQSLRIRVICRSNNDENAVTPEHQSATVDQNSGCTLRQSQHYMTRSSMATKVSGQSRCLQVFSGNNISEENVAPEHQLAVADHTPQNRASRQLQRYAKRSVGAERRKIDAQLEKRKLSSEKSLSDKADRAKAIEYNLMRRQYTLQNEELMQLSQLVSDQKHDIKAADETVAVVKKKLKQSQSVAVYYKKRSEKNIKKASNVVDITAGLEIALSKLFPGKHPATKAKLLFDEIISGRLYNGEARNVVNDYVRSYIKDLFKPWRVLKAGDVSAIGAFKTSTVKALNEVIDREKLGFFPSPSAVDRARAKLDNYAFEMIGYERRETIYGEVYYLGFEKALRFLLKACELHNLAITERVKISLSIDGADLFKDRTHVSAGIKISDPRGVHPVTRQPLFIREEDGEEKIVKIQSSEMCCILIIADARDKKELYEDIFKEFYEWGAQIQNVGLPASDHGPALLPFHVAHTTDLKASWYLSNRGGGCKNKNYFCTFCPCTRHNLVSYNIDDERCNRCKCRQKRKCYHHAVCDSVSVPILLQCLEEELGGYFETHRKSFQTVRQRSKLRTDHLQVSKDSDIMHIEYIIPHEDEDKLREYTQFISRECRLRSIPLHGRLEDWRMRLYQAVTLERSIDYLVKVKEWYDSGLETVPLVDVIELLIPCILHCENRVGEKILTIILRRQLDQFRGPKASFVERMDLSFRTEVLGSDISPSHWRLKHSKDPDGKILLEPIQVRNQIARKMIAKIDVIVEAAVPESDQDFRAKVISAVSAYKEAISLLTMHRNLSAEEKELFQDKIDEFYEQWIDLFGEEGMTNYIHILGSGHMLYFLQKYDCLYMYSQQGWEDLNNRCQAFLMQNSSRGGYGSGEGKGKSYTFPIVRYILRDLLWKTGDADQFFSTLESA